MKGGPGTTPTTAARHPGSARSDELFVHAPTLRGPHSHLIEASLRAVRDVDFQDSVVIVQALYRFAALCVADLQRRRRGTGFSVSFTGHWGQGGKLVITTETRHTLADQEADP